MANARGKTVDTTFLSLTQAEERGFIHRDYIAHCFRWSHVVKRLMKGGRYKTARILDIGCGRELPFPFLMYSNKMVPAKYVGIDAGPILPEYRDKLMVGKMGPVTALHERTCFSKDWAYNVDREIDAYTDIICFECAEHVEPDMLKDMLAGMRAILHASEGRVWLSTPCWDYKSCAANHVNEMTYAALGSMLTEQGFVIENVHGTFASISDYKDQMSDSYLEVFNDLRDYYDTNVLSTIFAPMFPAFSRNALWELRLPRAEETPEWGPLADENGEPLRQQPWGSSSKWKEMHDPNWKNNW